MATKVTLFGYDIFSDPVECISFNNKLIINTINPHSYCVAKNDSLFQRALKQSDILLPDGVGIVKALKWIKRENIKKIAGSDIHNFLLDKANNEQLKVFYLGSSENTLLKIKERLLNEFPKISIETYSPPFKDVFTNDETKNMLVSVNEFSPDILFVGMTAPKQEKWVEEHKHRLNSRVICSIGAVFDFYAGTVERPPKWLISLGLEWLGRLLKEPKRMWRRNFVSTPIFLKDVFVHKIELSLKRKN